MYNLKPLKRINTNARLNIKIGVKKVGLEMTLEFRDVCNVPLLECRAVTRNLLTLGGVRQITQPISAVSGPKFTML